MADINVTVIDTGVIAVVIGEPDPINIAIDSGSLVEHNFLAGLQGGDTDELYHLSLADYTELSEWLDDVVLGSDGITRVPQLVLVPSAAAIEAIEGGMFYNNADKSVYVCTDI